MTTAVRELQGKGKSNQFKSSDIWEVMLKEHCRYEVVEIKARILMGKEVLSRKIKLYCSSTNLETKNRLVKW